jgi:hypothetical protein
LKENFKDFVKKIEKNIIKIWNQSRTQILGKVSKKSAKKVLKTEPKLLENIL